MIKSPLIQLILTMLITNYVIGCSGTYVGSPDEDEKPPQKEEPVLNDPTGSITKKFSLALTDAPVEDLSAFFINLSEIVVKPSQGALFQVPLAVNEEINILDYQDGSSLLIAASDSIPDGEYTELRLVLSSERPVRALDINGNEVEAQAPSADNSGIKVAIDFTISDQNTGLTVDFDLRQSLNYTGNKLKLTPRLRAVKNNESYTIAGTSGGDVLCLYENTVPADDSDNCVGSITSAKIKKGSYRLAFINNGTYYIRRYGDSNVDTEVFEVNSSDLTINVP